MSSVAVNANMDAAKEKVKAQEAAQEAVADTELAPVVDLHADAERMNASAAKRSELYEMLRRCNTDSFMELYKHQHEMSAKELTRPKLQKHDASSLYMIKRQIVDLVVKDDVTTTEDICRIIGLTLAVMLADDVNKKLYKEQKKQYKTERINKLLEQCDRNVRDGKGFMFPFPASMNDMYTNVIRKNVSRYANEHVAQKHAPVSPETYGEQMLAIMINNANNMLVHPDDETFEERQRACNEMVTKLESIAQMDGYNSDQLLELARMAAVRLSDADGRFRFPGIAMEFREVDVFTIFDVTRNGTMSSYCKELTPEQAILYMAGLGEVYDMPSSNEPVEADVISEEPIASEENKDAGATVAENNSGSDSADTKSETDGKARDKAESRKPFEYDTPDRAINGGVIRERYNHLSFGDMGKNAPRADELIEMHLVRNLYLNHNAFIAFENEARAKAGDGEVPGVKFRAFKDAAVSKETIKMFALDEMFNVSPEDGKYVLALNVPYSDFSKSIPVVLGYVRADAEGNASFVLSDTYAKSSKDGKLFSVADLEQYRDAFVQYLSMTLPANEADPNREYNSKMLAGFDTCIKNMHEQEAERQRQKQQQTEQPNIPDYSNKAKPREKPEDFDITDDEFGGCYDDSFGPGETPIPVDGDPGIAWVDARLCDFEPVPPESPEPESEPEPKITSQPNVEKDGGLEL